METTEIIKKAMDAVNGIYDKINRIEECQSILEYLDGADVLLGKGDKVSDLHKAMSDDQIADVMASIHSLLKRNIDEAAGDINKICGVKDEPGCAIKAAVKDKPEPNTEAPKPANNSKSTLPPDEEEKLLRQLYVKEQKTVKQIADIMGLTKSNIYDRIKKYGLRNARYDREWDEYALESSRRMK